MKSEVLMSKIDTFYDFVGVDKIVKTGALQRRIIDYKLSRYACYLIAQNGDSRKKAKKTFVIK